MKRRLFTTLLAMLMLCALVGCRGNTDTDKADEPPTTATTATTTTTTQAAQDRAPISLVEGEVPADCYRKEDASCPTHNTTVIIKANEDLADVRWLALNPDPPTVSEQLYYHFLLNEGEIWAVDTYINDAVPNRGVACTDTNGKLYYYAITWSGKDSSLSLQELDIAILSEERLAEIETMLNANENNGFVSMNEYSCPEEADLLNILYDGAGIGVNSWDWSEEEQNDYLVAAEWEEWYISALRFARADVETLIQKRLGIPLDELDSDMLYIEKYDAYYHAHSDTQYQPIEVLGGWLEGGEGGLYIIDYKIGWGDGKGRVTLRSTKDGYQFVSNKKIEE